MAIQFLRVTPEQAVETIQECAQKGYATKLVIQKEHDEVGPLNITDSMVTGWIKRINDWTEETRHILLNIYTSPNYMYKFLETTPNLISTGEEQRFVGLRHGLLQRVEKLNEYVDFIIQNSNPALSINNELTYLHLNPERDLNIAGKDIKTENS